jgi:hypothetical protein
MQYATSDAVDSLAALTAEAGRTRDSAIRLLQAHTYGWWECAEPQRTYPRCRAAHRTRLRRCLSTRTCTRACAAPDGSIRSADGPSCKCSASAALARPFLQEQSVLRVPKVPKVLVYALAGECELLDAMIERVGHDDQPLALRDRLPRATVVARCLATILRHVPSLRLATPRPHLRCRSQLRMNCAQERRQPMARRRSHQSVDTALSRVLRVPL